MRTILILATGLVLPLMTGCANVAMHAASDNYMACVRVTFAKPEYAPLQPHMVANLPTLAQLTDDTYPTPEEAVLAGRLYDDTKPCFDALISNVGAVRPDLVPIITETRIETGQRIALEVERKITWGEAAHRLQDLTLRSNEAMRAGRMLVPPSGQGDANGRRIDPLSTTLPTSEPPRSDNNGLEVTLRKQGGVLVVPVVINDAITLDFVIDSGAADVSVPADVVLTLMRAGTITGEDFLGQQKYRLADGSIVPSDTFRVRSLRVGDRTLHNVIGSVAPVNGTLLLGQSFLSRFGSWSIDNSRGILLVN